MILKISLITSFFTFCILLHENNTEEWGFDGLEKPSQGATIIVSWENSLKKEGASSKIERDTEMKYKRLQEFWHKLQKLDWH